MAQIKHQYHRKTKEWHAKADITVDLKRPDIVKMEKWTTEERNGLVDYISTCEASFQEFINELKKQLPHDTER